MPQRVILFAPRAVDSGIWAEPKRVFGIEQLEFSYVEPIFVGERSVLLIRTTFKDSHMQNESSRDATSRSVVRNFGIQKF